MLYDDNGISIDGPTSLSDSVDQVKRFKSAGWEAELIDGQDQKAIAAAITRAQKSRQALADRLQDHHRLRRADQGRHHKAHGEALGAEELKGAKENARHLAGAVLGSRRRAEGLARGRQRGAARASRMGSALCRARRPQARRIRAPPVEHERPAALAKALRKRTRRRCWKAAQHRHPQIVGSRRST